MIAILFVFYLCLASHIFGELTTMDWVGLSFVSFINFCTFAVKHNEKIKNSKVGSFSFNPKEMFK